MSLLARDLLDREPLKIHIGLDDIQESELASRPLRAACGKSERALALRRLVDDHEKFPPMAFGENLPLPARARLACAFARLRWGLPSLFRLLLRHGGMRGHGRGMSGPGIGPDHRAFRQGRLRNA